MKLAGALRKEFIQLRRDPAGLTLAAVVPVGVVGLYSILDLGRRAFPHDFRETDPLAMILTLAVWLAALTLASTAILRERLTGTLHRLEATPFSRVGMITAKAAALGTVGLLQGLLVWLTALLLVPDELADGANAAMLASLILTALVATALGLLVSGLITSHAQAAHAVTLLTLASITVSGFLRPLADLGAIGQAAAALPFTIAYTALRQGLSGTDATAMILLLAAQTLLMMLAAIATMRHGTRTPRG